MKTTVIHHSADYDGLFCREIARKFLPDAELIGWDFGDQPIPLHGYPGDQMFYILDLPVDRVFGFDFAKSPDQPFFDPRKNNVVWIDHHKSAIETHPRSILGYRIDGVAACRLAWQWFTHPENTTPRRDPKGVPLLPLKEEFIARKVFEPLAVRLAGEYDIWDHRGDGDLEFQFGLDSAPNPNFQYMLRREGDDETKEWVKDGAAAMRCYAKRDADVMRQRSFMVEFEGLKFLALNTARCNSNTFAALDIPETGHDGLLAFYTNGSEWTVSLYHASHRKEIDLSLIAVRYGGGGHRGACGFRVKEIEFRNGQMIVLV